MIALNKENVLSVHALLAERTGGGVGVRDVGLIESALGSVYQSFDGVDLYPTVEEKGARLGFALISNHAFVDGNKRVGLLVMLTFLAISGAPVRASDDELVDVTLAVASGGAGYSDLLDWVRSHVEK